MYSFSEKSSGLLLSCDDRLQTLFNEVIKQFNCVVICGHRGEKEQNEAYNNKKSQLKYPDSKHNKHPSLAVDVAPFPIDWSNIDKFKKFGNYVKFIANKLNIDIAWGGDWKFKDYPHFELK